MLERCGAELLFAVDLMQQIRWCLQQVERLQTDKNKIACKLFLPLEDKQRQPGDDVRERGRVSSVQLHTKAGREGLACTQPTLNAACVST